VAAERLVRNAQPTGTLIIKAATPFTSAWYRRQRGLRWDYPTLDT